MEEIWKDIKDYKGYYRISENGIIENIKTGLIKSPYKNDHGYLITSLYKDGSEKHVRVHRLLGIAFIPNPENKRCINHKNGIKDDNRLCNLEWMTHTENNQHAYDTGLKKPSHLGRFGKEHHRSVPVIQLNLDGSFICEHEGLLCAERATDTRHANITKVCKGERHTAGGFKWVYKTDYNGRK